MGEEAAKRLELGWDHLFANRFAEAESCFRAVLHTEVGSMAALGLAMTNVMAGQEERVPEILTGKTSPPPASAPEAFLVLPFLRKFSQFLDENTPFQTAYLERLAAVPGWDVTEKRRILRELMSAKMDAGDARAVEALARQLHYLTDWSLIGPFENVAGSGHFRSLLRPSSISPSDLLRGKWNVVFRWIETPGKHTPLTGTIDLANYFSTATNATGYATSTITVPQGGNYLLSISHYGALKVWVNGSPVYECDRYIRRREYAHLEVPLRAGNNQIFVQASGLAFSADFAIALSALGGEPIQGLTVSPSVLQVPDTTVADAAKMLDIPFFSKLKRRFESEADSPEVFFWYLAALLALDDDEETRLALSEVPTEFEGSALIQMTLGALYANMAEWEKARQALERALAVAPDCVPAILAEARFELNRGMTARAEELLAAADSVASGSVDVDLMRIDLARATEKKTDVVALAQGYADRFPFLRRPLDFLQEHYAEIGEMALERKYRNALLETLPRRLSLRFRRDEALKKEDFATAKRLTEELCKLEPADPENIADLAFLTFLLGNPKGFNELKALRTTFPYSKRVIEYLAQIQSAIGQNDEAQELYEELLRLDPSDFEVRNKVRSLKDKPRIEEILTPPEIDFDFTGGQLREPDHAQAVVLGDVEQRVVFRDGATVKRRDLVIRINNDAGVRRFGRMTIPGILGLGDLNIIEARTLKPNGTRVEAELSGNVVIFQSLVPGDIIELRYTINSFYFGDLSNEFWDEHQFQWDIPCKISSYALLVPPPTEFQHVLHNADTTTVEYTKAREGEFMRYEWTMRDLPPYWAEANAPHARDMLPWLDVSTIDSWGRIAEWYEAITTWPSQPTVQVRLLAEELCRGAETKLEEVRALFEFVRDEIEYEDVLFGTRAVVPRLAKNVLSSQYGDCKDQTSLLVGLLQARGIPAHFVLASDDMGETPYLPSPRFNHTFVAAEVDGRRIYLDPTREALPFDPEWKPTEKTWVLLVEPGADLEPLWLRPEERADTVEVVGRIADDGTIQAAVVMTIRNVRRVEASRLEGSLLIEPDRKEFLQMTLAEALPGCVATDIQWKDNDDGSCETSYSLTLPGVGPRGSDEGVLFPMLLAGRRQELAGLAALPSRGKPLVTLPYAGDSVYELELTLPRGVRISGLPEDLRVSCDQASYERSLRVEGNRLVCRSRLRVLSESVDPEEYGSFKRVLDAAMADQMLALRLRKARGI
jgi:transglutaminase-like putative cysteine protease/tetratricopeptide (TPR) repeat protein